MQIPGATRRGPERLRFRFVPAPTIDLDDDDAKVRRVLSEIRAIEGIGVEQV